MSIHKWIFITGNINIVWMFYITLVGISVHWLIHFTPLIVMITGIIVLIIKKQESEEAR